MQSSRFTNQQQFFDGNLTVVSEGSNTVYANVPVSAYFYGGVTDNLTGALYALTLQTLTVFNATTVTPIYSTNVNESAYFLAVDPARGAMFIVDPSYDIYVPGEVNVYEPPLPSAAATSASFLGLPAGEGFGVVLGVIAVATAVVAFFARVRQRRRDVTPPSPPQQPPPSP